MKELVDAVRFLLQAEKQRCWREMRNHAADQPQELWDALTAAADRGDFQLTPKVNDPNG